MKLVIRRRPPILPLLLGLAVVALVAAVGWQLYQSQRSVLHARLERMSKARAELEGAAEALRREKQALMRRVAVLERSRQVESAAYARVDQHLHALQDEMLGLKEELAFYRGIVADASRGQVRIQRFIVEREGGPRDFRFRLVLTRGIRNDQILEGSVFLAIHGDLNGERKRLKLSDLTPLQPESLGFRFKHFQRLEGRLRLPERFEPHSVTVQVSASGSGEKGLQESFPWPSAKG